MIKHIAICDKCKKEEAMKNEARWCVDGDGNKEIFQHYVLPEHWEKHGIFPEYTLCSRCSAELKGLIQDEIYKFVNRDKKEGR